MTDFTKLNVYCLFCAEKFLISVLIDSKIDNNFFLLALSINI